MSTRLQLRRQQSMTKHRVQFEQIIKSAWKDLISHMDKEVVAPMLEVIKDLGEGRNLALEMMMTRYASDLQRSVDRYSNEQIAPIWAKYDKNEDGYLQKAEMRTVVSSLIQEIGTNIPQMVETAMEPATDNLKEWIESDAVGPMGYGQTAGAQNIFLDASVKERIQKAAKNLSDLLKFFMTELAQSSQEISDEIFDVVDADKDGKVSKREFNEGFSEAFGTVMDFSKITQIVLQERATQAKLQRERSSVMLNSTDKTVAGLVVLALAVSAGFIMWKRSR